MATYIGLDLGGTNIKAGVADEHGTVLAKVSIPTGANHGPDAVIAKMVEASRMAAKEAGLEMAHVDGIGIGSPGPMDLDAGIVINSPNLPGWQDVPLRDRVSAGTGRPAVLENDANVAAFGEYWVGAGKDNTITDMAMLTLGTGVGTGLVVDGSIVHGGFGVGGEGGHLLVYPNGRKCGCGQHGCLEAYASASSTANRAIEAVQAGEASSLASLTEPITCEAVFAAAARGDALAKRIVAETAECLGLACVTLCRLLDPQMIVFAGGMIHAGEALFDQIRAAYARHTWAFDHHKTRIVAAELGNDAGVIGAAAVAWDAHRHGKLVSASS